SASLARVVPMSGAGRTNSLLIEGQEGVDSATRGEGTGRPEENPNIVNTNVVWLKYFSTMGISRLRGRDFTEQDDESGTMVAVVNEGFTRRYFADQDALGKRVSLHGARGPW